MPPPAHTVTITPRSMPVRGGCRTPRRAARWSLRSSTTRSDQKSAAGATSRKRRTMASKVLRTRWVPGGTATLAVHAAWCHAGAPCTALVEKARNQEADRDPGDGEQHVGERVEGDQAREPIGAETVRDLLVADA